MTFPKYTKSLIKILISLILLTILYLNTNVEQFMQSIKKFNLVYIPIIIILLILNYVISAYRWKKLIKIEKEVSLWYLTKLYFIGSFFNNFMPTSIGGDVFKIYKLGRKIDDAPHAFSATFMERFTGVLSLLIIASISVVFTYNYIGIIFLIAVLLSLLCVIFGIRFISNKFPKIKKYLDALYYYKGKKSMFYSAIVTSFVIQFFAIFTQYFIFLALGINLNIIFSLFVFPVITLASFFIPSLNGIGVQDSLYGFFFASVATIEVALVASVLYHFFRLLVSLIGGAFYALDKETK